MAITAAMNSNSNSNSSSNSNSKSTSPVPFNNPSSSSTNSNSNSKPSHHQSYSVGSTTSTPSLTDQIKRYKPRTFKEQPPPLLTTKNNTSLANNPAREKLTMKCIKVIVDNFTSRPAHLNSIPSNHLLEITSRLPTDLDPSISSTYVHDENYWKRCCLSTLPSDVCVLNAHGLSWKQMYFESFLKTRLETFNEDVEDVNVLLEEVQNYQDNIFTLSFAQLPSHIDLSLVTRILPNLTKLSVKYSISKIGMSYDRMLFGLKISDASSLARSIRDSAYLTTIDLSGNLIDDDLLRMLMTGLYKSFSVTSLDVSHNKITNHGVRLLAKLLGLKSVLVRLNVSDNMIHAEGGRYIGRALRGNESLVELNMRLNRLTDEGGRMLMEGLRDNVSVTRLNLSSNSLGSETTTALSVVLREPANPLATLDLSGNLLNDADVEMLSATLVRNKKLVSLDLRMNDTNDDERGREMLDGIRAVLRKNELNFRR